MWHHGKEVGDTRLNTTSRLTGETVSALLPVPQGGIPCADRLIPALYVSESKSFILYMCYIMLCAV